MAKSLLERLSEAKGKPAKKTNEKKVQKSPKG